MGGAHSPVLAGGMVPVVPPSRRHHVVEVGVGVDDPRVLPHGAANVERPRPRHPAIHERESRLLAGAPPVLRRDRPKPRRDRMKLAALQQKRAATVGNCSGEAELRRG